ncbi:MAG: hypothetical protein MUF27_00260 [Acidobacteria bacterium]|nr:hypothetical protein [Acidobacteriota bacterium]
MRQLAVDPVAVAEGGARSSRLADLGLERGQPRGGVTIVDVERQHAAQRLRRLAEAAVSLQVGSHQVPGVGGLPRRELRCQRAAVVVDRQRVHSLLLEQSGELKRGRDRSVVVGRDRLQQLDRAVGVAEILEHLGRRQPVARLLVQRRGLGQLAAGAIAARGVVQRAVAPVEVGGGLGVAGPLLHRGGGHEVPRGLVRRCGLDQAAQALEALGRGAGLAGLEKQRGGLGPAAGGAEGVGQQPRVDLARGGALGEFDRAVDRARREQRLDRRRGAASARPGPRGVGRPAGALVPERGALGQPAGQQLLAAAGGERRDLARLLEAGARAQDRLERPLRLLRQARIEVELGRAQRVAAVVVQRGRVGQAPPRLEDLRGAPGLAGLDEHPRRTLAVAGAQRRLGGVQEQSGELVLARGDGVLAEFGGDFRRGAVLAGALVHLERPVEPAGQAEELPRGGVVPAERGPLGLPGRRSSHRQQPRGKIGSSPAGGLPRAGRPRGIAAGPAGDPP